MKREVRIEGKSLWIDASRQGDAVQFTTGDQPPRTASIMEAEPGVYSVLLDGRSYRVRLARGRKLTLVSVEGREYTLEVVDPRNGSSRRSAAGHDGPQVLTAPMPGKIVRRLVSEGDEVEGGQGIVVVEAMKMQNELKALRPGRVVSLPVAENATVASGDTLAVIE